MNEYELPFEALIVLGKNIGVNSGPSEIQRDNFLLSTDSRINVLAAIEVYQPGMKVIFSTGHTAGKDFPSEAQAMYRYFKIKVPTVPDADIFFDEKSIDTAGNAQHVKKIVNEHNIQFIGIVTTHFHLKNAATLFQRNKIPVTEAINATEVVRNRSRHHKLFIEKYESSKRVKKERMKERLRTAIMLIDRKGTLLHQISKRTRG